MQSLVRFDVFTHVSDKGNAPDPLNSECDELSVKREFMRPFEDPLVLKHEEMHPMMGVYSPLWSP